MDGSGTAGGVRFAVEQEAPVVVGRLRYDRRRLSFDFRPDEPEVALRERDAVELAFGSLCIQLERDGHGLLGVWGYHPDAGWLNGSLGSPAAVPARLRATLCFYMGVRRLPEIVHSLAHHGMPADTPLALISEATQPTQKITLTTLAEAAAIPPEKIAQPALVVVGEVVRFSDFATQVPGLFAQAKSP